MRNGIKTMKGRLTGIQMPFRAKYPVITLEVEADPEDLEQFNDMELEVKLSKFSKKRSNDANALLWACIGDIAKALRASNWDVYLLMLERYGEFTTILVKPEAVEGLKRQWRETKVIGERDQMVEVMCFYGSSTYNAREMSRLIEGVVSEMKEMHLQAPASERMREILEELERKEDAKRQKQARKDGKE